LAGRAAFSWIFGACAVALVVALPFTGVGRLHASDGRLWVAAVTAAAALAAIAALPRVAERLPAGAAVCGAAAGFALALLGWSVDAPRHVAAPGTTPARLDVAGAADGTGIRISNADAARLLATHGIPAADVQSYVLSFYGPIDAETLQPGTTFLRYSAKPTGAGRFLTTKRFTDARTAQLALHLSWFNTAVCKARVKVLKPTLVLVGAIAFGEPGVKQYVILEPDAFSFGGGSAYSSAACS
jgi:hypothetical protein